MSFSPVLVIVPREWADLPPLPGRLKDRPEDFCVEEVLGRTPAGHGSHVWVEVEKTGLSMDQLVRELCGALGLHPAHVGHAGLKDRHAVTRQTLSLPAWAGERLGELRLEGVRILGWRQHPGALHPGQLDGNHFTILLRGDNGHRLGEAEAWCRRLSGLGAANAFGPQRFGRDLETLRAGLAMLRGEPDTGRMGAAAPGLALSAAQGHLFNR
ncbi:MAG: tRNA pseudouridine(13) synthase TruD, partial [Deltaproteobacteria bacterium]|nr:tRNA pseudouridine(13) synthase TruD [Deltaproteobacteria bacterium]